MTELRLKWANTGLGRTKDYLARDPGRPRAYCRVYKSNANSSGESWFWTASDGTYDLGTGYAETSRQAVELAEAAYFAKRDAGGS